MITVRQALEAALAYHQSGELPQAERLYRQVLQVDPQNGDALHLLGLLAHQVGRSELAVEYIGAALRSKPEDPDAHLNCGVALAALGRWEEAQPHQREALRLRPDWPEAYLNLGAAQAGLGQTEQAVASYREALRLRPDYPEVHLNLGAAVASLGQVEQALTHYREAVRLRPDYPEAHYNLGNTLKGLGRTADAVASLRAAVRLRPTYAEAHNNLGATLKDLGRPEEAVASCRAALRLQPDYAEAHNNLGNALRALGLLEESVASYREAVRLTPGSAEVQLNLGTALVELGRSEEALGRYREALRLRPDWPKAHMSLGMALLRLGDCARGWPEYEWRRQCEEWSVSVPSQPLWDGSPLAGRTILLLAEQGLGDTLQFVRYASLVKQQGGTVLLACPSSLRALLAEVAGIDHLVTPDAPVPPFDVYAPLASLPGIFGTSLANVPADIPYLSADPDLVEHWRGELESFPGFRVGIAWQGNPNYATDRERSFPLRLFEPVARVAGVRLFGLQKGHGREQLAEVAGLFPLLDLGPRLDAPAAFVDTAAVMRNLDLVISSDTALAHLAGGLGVRGWLALPWIPDWRWLLERQDSPWYPTMRLFRQQARGEWPPVFERLAVELRALLAGA